MNHRNNSDGVASCFGKDSKQNPSITHSHLSSGDTSKDVGDVGNLIDFTDKEGNRRDKSPLKHLSASKKNASDLTDSIARGWEKGKKDEEEEGDDACAVRYESKPSFERGPENIGNKQGEARDYGFHKDVVPTVTSRCCGWSIDDLKGHVEKYQGYLQPRHNQVVLVQIDSLIPGQIPKPFHSGTSNSWNSDTVKMPCSSSNVYESSVVGRLKSRWKLIEKVLTKPLKSTHDIEKAIKAYNKKYENVWKFEALHRYVETLQGAERDYLFKMVIPEMAKLALQLPELCPKPIPLLKRGKMIALTLSQQQIACLLTNAFFCTFPHRNTTQSNSEYANYPSINFSRLFEEWNSRKKEKLQTILSYFSRVTENMPTGVVTFERWHIRKDEVNWKKSKCKLPRLCLTSEGNIEKDGAGMLQVDFASSMVGGGVLGSGLVQEEIRFLINTELIVSRLFTEKLDDNECLLITGAEQYSVYRGYSDTYEWVKAFQDQTERDSCQRRCTRIVAIDAMRFRNPNDQYRKSYMDRELNKAYCGFKDSPLLPQKISAIATGSWGCGAFNGDPKFKALLQLMAAAEARKDVVFFTFGNHRLMHELYELYLFLKKKKDVSVGTLYTQLECYCALAKEEKRDLLECLQFLLSQSKC